MRERIAIVVALFAVCFAVAMSALFAWKHNAAVAKSAPAMEGPAGSEAAKEPAATSPEKPAGGGAAIYEDKNCRTCHAISGVGNPRYPLDGVGSRLNRSELREAITGAGLAASKMSRVVRQRKARYAEMPEEEMSKLVDYLSGLDGR